MKTLVISVDYPLPEDKGSRMRTMHFVRFFKGRGEVDLMCYRSHAPKVSVTSSPFRKEFYLDLNQRGEGDKEGLLEALRAKFLDSKPWIVNSFGAETVAYVREVIESEDYDAILCRYSVNAYPLLGLPAKYRQRVVLDIDDVVNGDLYDAMNGTKKGIGRFKAEIDKIVLCNYQKKCLGLGNILFCSEDDKLGMSGPAAKNVSVVPNIVPKQAVPAGYLRSGYQNATLLFVGALSYQPNEMGIIWFIREIFQKLPERFQGMRLQVVGKDPREALRQICAATPGIELVANPPDVLPYYERCHALVVPVLVGGGTRIKILEAGNFLRPVLSTELGAYGLGLEDRKNVLYFHDRTSFSEKLAWLGEGGNYQRVTDNLKEVVSSNFSEQVFAQRMTSVLERI